MRGAGSSQVRTVHVVDVKHDCRVCFQTAYLCALLTRCRVDRMQEWAGFAQMLAAGIYGGHMAQAAELLAFAKPNWPQKARAQRMFLEIIHPACSLFCGRTSDSTPHPRPQTCEKGANGNWCVRGTATPRHTGISMSLCLSVSPGSVNHTGMLCA